jgi:hypothetical protein
MSISVTPILPVIAAESAAPDLLLQPGSVVDALVLKILSDDLVRIAIANVSIDVLSEIPLAVGQSLQLAVSQTQDGIRLAVVGQEGAASTTSADTTRVLPNPVIEAAGVPANPSAVALPSRNVLTPLERVAVSTAAEIAATQQQSLAPLFANLGAVAGAANFPARLQQAVAQVLAQRTNLDPELTGVEVKNAFQKSGLFLEAALASQSVLPASGIPDLKAALIVLRQTLAASLGSAATTDGPATPLAVAPPQPAVPGIANPPAIEAANPQPTQPSPTLAASLSPALVPSQSPETDANDFLPLQVQAASQAAAVDDILPPGSAARIVRSAVPLNAASRAVASDAVLSLLEETLQPTARVVAASLLPVAALQNDRGDVTFHTNTPPPPFRGALPAPQPIAEPSIASGAPLAITAHRLLGDTDAAIARQTLLQVASLPDRIDTPGVQSDPITPRWHFEIPFATPQGTAMAQFEISQQGGGNDVEAA